MDSRDPPDGNGHFRTERGNAVPTDDIEPPDIDRDFQVSTPFARHIFRSLSGSGSSTPVARAT